MGLTASSMGKNAVDLNANIIKTSAVIALAGNPNVGKSSIFNALTGLNQHTGNWAGKTVTNAQGNFIYKNKTYTLVDIPGTYSLCANSVEEEVARDYICFGEPDCVVVVCDATILERNLNLVLQTIEITKNVIVCINLIDEAKKKGISIDLNKLEKLLGAPVVATSAIKEIGLNELREKISLMCENKIKKNIIKVDYGEKIEKIIRPLENVLTLKIEKPLNKHWLALKLVEPVYCIDNSLKEYLNTDITEDSEVKTVLEDTIDSLKNENLLDFITDIQVIQNIKTAEYIANQTVKYKNASYNQRDRKIDRILTGKYTGIPLMLVFLSLIMWITIVGANYPSKILATILFSFENNLFNLLAFFNLPDVIINLFVYGAYRVLAWVVSVMLPPMAIFFPMFTLLEDLGYLPRIAFNLDKSFKKCCACGKQALTMCMGFGCNAAGVVGCRIIDSPRERLIAIITNSLVPCNGRFPTLIAIITMFFAGTAYTALNSIIAALLLCSILVLGVLMTFLASKILSKTLLKGLPSTFTLELPPYRRPQIGKLIIRSIFDRTLFVLLRAITVAVPAGLIIWLMANTQLNGISVLQCFSQTLDPFAKLIGLDGVILMAFILGFPANEIVFPIILMAYLSKGSLTDYSSLSHLKTILTDNGWTWLTALCTMLFSLMHWPCSTTCMTIKKETQSIKWTLVSFIVPTILGISICFIITTISKLIF